METKEKLRLMKEIEARNRKRIKDFVKETRKRPSDGQSEKTYQYRPSEDKRK